jgi:hypothetical protein
MSNALLKKEIINKYKKMGQEKFNRFLVTYCLNILINIQEGNHAGMLPHIELLNYYDKFLAAYRSENKEEYLEIAYSFRKIAHKIYRLSLKKKIAEKNLKFLNIV